MSAATTKTPSNSPCLGGGHIFGAMFFVSSPSSPPKQGELEEVFSKANSRSHTAPNLVSFVSVPSSIILIGFFHLPATPSNFPPKQGEPEGVFTHSSKIPANLWFVIMICSSISGILSISSNILPKIVFFPIFSNGFGKFLVSSPNRVAYPAAITIFFIMKDQTLPNPKTLLNPPCLGRTFLFSASIDLSYPLCQTILVR